MSSTRRILQPLLLLLIANIAAVMNPDWISIRDDLYSGFFMAFAIGMVDLIEYAVFNPAVFYKHNFPDIVPDLGHTSSSAFCSGVLVSWFIYMPLRLIEGMFGIHMRGLPHLIVPVLCLLVMIYDYSTVQRIKKDIYYYHKRFYMIGAVVEVGWIIYSKLNY